MKTAPEVDVEIGPLEYSKLVMLISFNDFYNFPYCMALTDNSDCMSNSPERSSGLGNECDGMVRTNNEKIKTVQNLFKQSHKLECVKEGACVDFNT